MRDFPIGHKPHVAPFTERLVERPGFVPMLERSLTHSFTLATSVLPEWLEQSQNEEVVSNAECERDPKEKYFFVWFNGWKGTGFVQADAQFEAQIVNEHRLPKNTVFKVEVSVQDRRSIEELKLAFPWPVVDATFSGAVVAVNYYPAMFGGMIDVQG